MSELVIAGAEVRALQLRPDDGVQRLANHLAGLTRGLGAGQFLFPPLGNIAFTSSVYYIFEFFFVGQKLF